MGGTKQLSSFYGTKAFFMQNICMKKAWMHTLLQRKCCQGNAKAAQNIAKRYSIVLCYDFANVVLNRNKMLKMLKNRKGDCDVSESIYELKLC